MARDLIHNAVKNALINDGWRITDDPYTIRYDDDFAVYADLGADYPIAAQRADDKIVVEIKSFLGRSRIHELYIALGQYSLYQRLLKITAPERKLYLAVSDLVYYDFFQLNAVQFIVRDSNLSILVVNTTTEEVLEWIN